MASERTLSWGRWFESFKKLEIGLTALAVVLVCITLILPCVWIPLTSSAIDLPSDEWSDPVVQALDEIASEAQPWPPEGRFLTSHEYGSLAALVPKAKSLDTCSITLLTPDRALTVGDCAKLCRDGCVVRVFDEDAGHIEYEIDDILLAEGTNVAMVMIKEKVRSERYARYLAGPRMDLITGDALLALLDKNDTMPYGLPLIIGDQEWPDLPMGTPLMRGEAIYGFVGAIQDDQEYVQVYEAVPWIVKSLGLHID